MSDYTDDFIDDISSKDLKQYYKAIRIASECVYNHREHATDGGMIGSHEPSIYSDLCDLSTVLSFEIKRRKLKLPPIVWRR